ncbi:MAG: chitobiase/beta-hexosaminidase C-terminal domain-containing protein, partial [Planctomycetes bacterium]|nr:chitobiase/beta-hexosaminidase C-terminal domain-containing protein [Planctomycetota bacterium]
MPNRIQSLAMFAILVLASACSAAEVEVITLADGRVLTGVYDAGTQTITLSGAMAAVIRVPAAQIVSREPVAGEKGKVPAAGRPAAGEAPTGPTAPTMGAAVDPAVLAPLIAAGVPWEAGDRILIIGDLLAAPGQPELALRIHEALATAFPDKGIVVFSLQNHGLTLARVAAAAREEIGRRPPKLVLIMAGVGDVIAVLPPPPVKPVAPAKPTVKPVVPVAPVAPVKLDVPTADAWRATLTDLVTSAQQAGAAVVIATPAIVGDKPFDGLASSELDAYAAAARGVAAETKSGICDLRAPLMDRLLERNPKGSREVGVLSKVPGQLKPEAMDLCAGLVAQALADAVPRIPWTVDLRGGVFTGTTTVAVRTPRIAADAVTIHVTTNGGPVDDRSPVYAKPFAISATTLVRVLVVAKDGTKRSAQAWYFATPSRAADAALAESLPGLWVDHTEQHAWNDGLPSHKGLAPDLVTWWPNCDSGLLDRLPTARKPAQVACLRYSGFFVAPVEGDYVFAVTSDGEARLFFGTTAVVRVDRRATARSQQGAIHLAKGWHAISLFYGQAGSWPALTVEVAEPGRRLQPLPELLLRRAPQPPIAGPLVETVGDHGDPAAPWTVRLNGRAFTGTIKAEVEVLRIAPDRLDIHYTLDGTAPTVASSIYTKAIPISKTTEFKILAVSRADEVTVTAEAWFVETRTHPADADPGATLSGLWTEHCTLKRWVDP